MQRNANLIPVLDYFFSVIQRVEVAWSVQVESSNVSAVFAVMDFVAVHSTRFNVADALFSARTFLAIATQVLA